MLTFANIYVFLVFVINCLVIIDFDLFSNTLMMLIFFSLLTHYFEFEFVLVDTHEYMVLT